MERPLTISEIADSSLASGQYRMEHDSMGQVPVACDALWGAQTERSRHNFCAGSELMPLEVIHALAFIKKAAAQANAELGVIERDQADLICAAADEIIQGTHDGEFPLHVWQTGSGTQTNMNVNEVIANRGNQIALERAHKAGVDLQPPLPLHPNDTVNHSQSSNDCFPTAMHIAAVLEVRHHLIPALAHLIVTFKTLEQANDDVIKSGRTHLQDAVPISFAQEISGWRGLLEDSLDQIECAMIDLHKLALGGTAVGTGLNAPDGFAELAVANIAKLTGEPFVSDPNKFRALSGKDALVFSHGAIKGLAANMMKIANDVRWLASGPRDGLGEITIPANEPGSSIMPGKVNPTQCEAVTMVAVQVMGNDATIGFAASQGNFELNVFMPVIIYNYLQSVGLLADVIDSFDKRCASGIKANRAKMHDNLHNSLMLVTCLNPVIGYEKAAQVSNKAYAEGTSLKQACIELGFLTEEQFDKAVRPEEMI